MSKKTTPQLPRPKDCGWHFDARLFAAVVPFRAIADIRYYLRGACFLPHPSGGALLAATNGHQLAIAYDPEGVAVEKRVVPVSPAAASAATKASRKGAGWAAIVDGRLVIADKYEEVFIQPGKATVEGDFPDVFRVLPSDPSKMQPAALGAFNSVYIEALGKTGKLVAGKKHIGLSHWQMDTNSGMVTRYEAEPNLIVVTMPMLMERRGGPIPDSMLPMLAKPAPVAPAKSTEEVSA